MTAARSRRGTRRPYFAWIVTWATIGFLFLPIVVAVVYSFNSSKSLALFEGFSLRWYGKLFADQEILASLSVSVYLAALSTLISVVLGTLLAFGLVRAGRRWSGLGDSTVFLRLISPETAIAVALLLMFTQLGIQLSFVTLLLAHISLCIVFVTVVVRSRLAAISDETEDAAMDLGATPWEAVRFATLPQLTPAIIAAALLAFVISFDNFVTSFFTSGIGTPPLPVRIYSMIRFGVTPEVNAVGIVMLVLTIAAIALAFATTRWLSRRARTKELS